MTGRVPDERFQRRLEDLQVVDRAFARGRLVNVEGRTLHRTTTDQSVRIMSSDQLDAFDVKQKPRKVQSEFGDTPFGRGCAEYTRRDAQARDTTSDVTITFNNGYVNRSVPFACASG